MDGMQHSSPFDIIGSEMALDLLKVHDSIDISRYKSIDNAHVKKQRDYNHNEIDKIFTEMVEAERRVELSQKKQMQHRYRHVQQLGGKKHAKHKKSPLDRRNMQSGTEKIDSSTITQNSFGMSSPNVQRQSYMDQSGSYEASKVLLSFIEKKSF